MQSWRLRLWFRERLFFREGDFMSSNGKVKRIDLKDLALLDELYSHNIDADAFFLLPKGEQFKVMKNAGIDVKYFLGLV